MKTIGLIDEKVIKYNLINLKNLVFVVTEKCNLNCKYCGLSNIRLSIGFYGRKPLINMPLINKIINYVEHLHTKDRSIIYTMTTNCILLDKHIDFLAEKKFFLCIKARIF